MRFRRALRILGPGLITRASDDDPSGIGTYAQVGSQLGYGPLWMAVFTYPLMVGVEERCARIALRTGVGLGVSLRRRYPSWVAGGAVLALFFANAVNLGADLGAVAAGGQLLTGGAVPAIWLVAPVALGIFAFQAFSTYETIFRTFRWMTLPLLAYLVAVVFIHPDVAAVVAATFVPEFPLTRTFLLAAVAVLGTTISPYLFFWQASSEVDELRAAERNARASSQGMEARRTMAMARTDVLVGMALSNAVMWAIILMSAAELHSSGITTIATGAQAASALAPVAGPYASVLFYVGLIGSGLLAIPILSGSATYAIEEVMGQQGSFEDRPSQRPYFYGIAAAMTGIGLGLNLLGVNPIQALFYAAVVNGFVAPPLLLLIVRMGDDPKLMGPMTSNRTSRTLTAVTVAAMSAVAIVLVGTLLPFSW